MNLTHALLRRFYHAGYSYAFGVILRRRCRFPSNPGEATLVHALLPRDPGDPAWLGATLSFADGVRSAITTTRLNYATFGNSSQR